MYVWFGILLARMQAVPKGSYHSKKDEYKRLKFAIKIIYLGTKGGRANFKITA
jgi:hypothetical protein